ncbi:hypothetical protein EXIGLDRAFT_146821 [Exidia glandulosa HHB12029]|uniref:Uncharacterized protein n=1 Tax=Exidia glandulosa HHB12029 TaxID=1314781 RepID=A0A165FT39_EXIGL|nr:hypothetical protein EXIGLDRAFT_146821 [Exidia glandulosa HHB12029]
MDMKFGPSQLDVYLRKVERDIDMKARRATSGSRNATFRFFYCCSHAAWECIRCPYMRNILSFCQAPVDVALAFGNCWERLDHGAYSYASEQDPEATGSDFHYWLALSHSTPRGNILPEDYQLDFMRSMNPAIRSPTIPSALYIARTARVGSKCYNIVLSATMATFMTLRAAVSRDVSVALAKQDPFVLAVWQIECILRLVQHDIETKLYWTRRVSVDIDTQRYLQNLGMYSDFALYTVYIRSTITRLHLAIGQLRVRHALYVQKHRSTPVSARNFVDSYLDAQEAAAKDLLEDYKSNHDLLQGRINSIVGASDLRNGANMHDIMRENQKQTEATEGLAREAKRDSERPLMIWLARLLWSTGRRCSVWAYSISTSETLAADVFELRARAGCSLRSPSR